MAEIPDDDAAAESGPLTLWHRMIFAVVRRTWKLLALIVTAFLGAVIYTLFFPAPVPLTEEEIGDKIVEVMATATSPPPYSARVYQLILPSLVFIQIQSDEMKEEGGIGVGSGVVINANGDILTAHHVVKDAAEIAITYADGTRATAEIISTEPENDIAVLQSSRPPEIIVPAILGNPNAMHVGDETFTVGNPLGLAGSMSAGVISGFDRSIPFEDNPGRLEGLIQFDAAVNPGNSGGPLLNRNGQVIGIVTALANPASEDFFTGIGFAVPITTAIGGVGGPAY